MRQWSGRHGRQRLLPEAPPTFRFSTRFVSRRLLGEAVICASLFLAACATNPTRKTAPPLDLKIVHGRILDGTGAPWFRGDVGVRGDTIVSIGDLSAVEAKTTIDARDQIVSPGFIDLLGQSQGAVLSDPHLEGKVRQGVTTEVTGEGHSPGPIGGKNLDEELDPTKRPQWHTLGEYLDFVQKKGTALNFALMVGASNPRSMVIGEVDRQPTADEMREMEAIVDQAMRDGAFGLSTSLIYIPATFSTTEEIISLAKVAKKYGGVYFTHMRDEGDHIDMGLDEAFRIGRETGIPVNIWHLKIGGRANWGKMPHVIERIVEARASGLDVAANVYPYIASSTSLSTLLPNWALEGSYAAMQERLKNPEQLAKIVEALKAQVAKRTPHGIFVSRISGPLKPYEKRFLEDIATELNVSPDEALLRLFAETPDSPNVIFFSMSEEDVQYALKQPFVSMGADSGSVTPAARAAQAGAHPRAYGTFPRVVGHYVRDVKLLTLEDAVRKATSQAAERVNLFDRGILRAGMKADIIVFDPDTIRDVSTYEDPHHLSEGISDVIVNGVPVLRDGTMTEALPGKMLRGRGYQPKK
jgi:N-acyl-D-amino-acid deacylase